MDDQRDGTYEILDLGPAGYKRRKGGAEAVSPALDGEAEPVAVIDLGEGAAATAPSPPLPRWQRWAIMAAVLIAGVVVGGYGWHARTAAVEAAWVDLLAVDVQVNDFENPEQAHFHAQIHNAGSQDVTIIDLRWPGIPEAADDFPSEVTIPVGETRTVVTRGQISCDSGRPESLESEVRTDAGITSASVPVSSGTGLDFVYSFTCGSPDRPQDYAAGIYFPWVGVQAEVTSPHHMAIDLGHAFLRLEVVQVAVEAPGFAATPTNLPFEIRPESHSQLELDWTVTDCAATHDLGTVDIEFTFAEQPPATSRLPHWSIAELARLAVAECGS